MESGVGTWAECEAEPLTQSSLSLREWEETKRRPSHINAVLRTAHGTYHLKWFFHSWLRNPARAEWRSAQRISEVGVPTVHAIGWGRHVDGTFVVLRHVAGDPLDVLHTAGMDDSTCVDLAKKLARLVARLHDAGLCHRDLNVYHVFVDGYDVTLIDVGRVRRFRRLRWLIKDLASLLDSARFQGFPRRAARAFLAEYLRASRRSWIRRDLIRRVDRKARAYRRHNAKHGR